MVFRVMKFLNFYYYLTLQVGICRTAGNIIDVSENIRSPMCTMVIE